MDGFPPWNDLAFGIREFVKLLVVRDVGPETGGMADENVEHVIDKLGRMVCDPPFKDAWVKYKSAQARHLDHDLSLAERIEIWVGQSYGIFSTLEIDRELGIMTTKDKGNRNLCKQEKKLDSVV